MTFGIRLILPVSSGAILGLSFLALPKPIVPLCLLIPVLLRALMPTSLQCDGLTLDFSCCRAVALLIWSWDGWLVLANALSS